MVKLRHIDLNLLVILDALLDEAHVGRAARRVGLSQPATSNALARARVLLDDPLLVRVPAHGLRRTPRADALREPLRAALSDLSSILQAWPIEPADLSGTVRLVTPDVPGAALGADLIAELARRAPGIDLIFHPWRVGGDADRLERGEIDLFLSPTPLLNPTVQAEKLADHAYAVLMRHDHPLADRAWDLDAWLDYPHVVVSGRGDPSGSLGSALRRLGRTRRVACVVPSFLHALELVAETDLLATLPGEAIRCRLARGLVSRPPPIALEPVALYLVRHRRSDRDPIVSLVADLIVELVRRPQEDRGPPAGGRT